MDHLDGFPTQAHLVTGRALRSLVIVLFASCLTAPMTAHTQEAPGTVISSSCFQVLSAKMTYENKTVAQIKLNATVLGEAKGGGLLLLVSPDCLAETTKDPAEPAENESVPGGVPETGTSPADVQDLIHRIEQELDKGGEQGERVRNGAEGVRNFVQQTPSDGNWSQPLADAAGDLSSTDPTAAAIAAIAAACLTLSGGVACTLPIALGELFKLFESTSTEDFQAGVRTLTKLATGQPLSDDDYILIGSKGPPKWLEQGLRKIPSDSVAAYLNEVANDNVSSGSLKEGDALAIGRLGMLAQEQRRLTCTDVVGTVHAVDRVRIHVNVETRRAIHSAVFSKSRGYTRETAEELRRCLNDVFPVE